MRHDDRLQVGSAPGTLRFGVVPWCADLSTIDPAAWDQLALRTAAPNPFYERWALAPALEQFAGRHPVHLACLRDGNALVGLMPLSACRDYYGKLVPNLSGWLHHNAFCGSPLVAAGYELAFWTAMFDWADRSAGLAAFLHLPRQPGDGPVQAALIEALLMQRRDAAIVHQEERALLASELSPQSYFEQSMSAKRRKELRRLRKRLAEEGELIFARQEGDVDLANWIDDFLKLEQSGWKGVDRTSLADSAPTADFFRDALTGAANAGRLERLALIMDDRPIAMLANFLVPPGAFSFKTTFDEAYSRFSPGVLLQLENLDLLARPEIDWTDSCAAADHPMIERIWREKRAMASINVAIGGKLRRKAMRGLTLLETGSFPKGI